MKLENAIVVGDFPKFIQAMIDETKSKKFRIGFTKKDGSYRVGKFDTKHRVTWKQSDGTMYKRKGKERTTNPNEYLLAHDLEKNAPRNINYKTIQWIAIGKKLFKINDLPNMNRIRVAHVHKVKFSELKTLLKGTNEKK